MLALLLFIALRLLGAAILTVVYLLLAPLAVLAPTIGESGRAAFRGWATRLLGALVAKLIYALFLGVVLLTLSILDGLGYAGLVDAVAADRRLLVDRLRPAPRGPRLRPPRPRRDRRAWPAPRRRPARCAPAHARGERHDQSRPPPVGRTGRTTGQAFTATRSRLAEGRAEDAGRRRAEELGRARAADQGQAERLLAGEQRSAATPRVTRRERRSRPRRARRRAAPASPARSPPPARLVIADAPCDYSTATRACAGRPTSGARRSCERADTIARAADARDAAGRAFSEGDLEERGLLLDREARKRRGVVPGPRADPDAYRDYQRLAPLASLSSDAYRALPPAEQRRARLTIDRELDARRARDRSSGPRRRATPRAPGRSTAVRALRLELRETPLERRRRQLGQLRDQRGR